MKEKKYISLVHKQLTTQLTEAEQAAYDVMLESVENKELADQMSFIWDKAADYKPTSFQPNTAAAFHKFKSQIANEEPQQTAKVVQMNPMLWITRIAAASIFVIAALFLFNNSNNTVSFDEQFATTIDIEKTVLTDGTEVWLDKNSSIEIASAFGEETRTVKINGSGYFEVARDEAHPFIVHMGDNRLEVLGTAFNIDNTNTDKVLVEVESGIVKVKTATKDAILRANDSAALIYGEDKIITSVIENKKTFDWYKTSLEIQDLPIATVMERIEEHYDVKINLASNVNTSCTLTSPLMEGNTIENIFEVLSATYDMNYIVTKNGYDIKYLSCK